MTANEPLAESTGTSGRISVGKRFSKLLYLKNILENAYVIALRLIYCSFMCDILIFRGYAKQIFS